MISSIFTGWAAVAGGTALLSVVTLIVSAILWQVMRRHADIIAAAERLEPVALTSVAVWHLPPSLRTNQAGEELPLLKQAVARKTRFYTRLAIGAAAAAVLTGSATGLATYRHATLAKERAAALSVPDLDVLRIVRGTWGAKFNEQQSCSHNPVTITVSDDHQRVTIRFRQPIWDGSRDITSYEYRIIEPRRNMLAMSLIGSVRPRNNDGTPIEWRIVFKDMDTYEFRRSDALTDSSGDMVRCRGGANPS